MGGPKCAQFIICTFREKSRHAGKGTSKRREKAQQARRDAIVATTCNGSSHVLLLGSLGVLLLPLYWSHSAGSGLAEADAYCQIQDRLSGSGAA